MILGKELDRERVLERIEQDRTEAIWQANLDAQFERSEEA